jgi:hypothetical protein
MTKEGPMKLNDSRLPLPISPCFYCDCQWQSVSNKAGAPLGTTVYESCQDNGGCARRRKWAAKCELWKAIQEIRAHFKGGDPQQIEADIDVALMEVRRERFAGRR